MTNLGKLVDHGALFSGVLSCYADAMDKKMCYRIASLLLIVFVSGCAAGPATPSLAPLDSGTSLPSSSPTPPLVVVISPTPGPAAPVLRPTPGPDFCADPQVQTVLAAFTAALQDLDGAALAETIDPVDGLDIFYRIANAPVHITPTEVVGLFNNTFTYTWGDQAGSGLPVEGAFSSEILPLLLNVFDQTNALVCQDLATGSGTGPTTALVEWPAQFAGMPFVAVYRAAGVQDNELDWRTWAVGFTVVNGQPKIRVLVQYAWEI